VDEVREFSMELILKIVKVAGLLLTPYVPMLVGVLLNALDELEQGGGKLNYLQVQAEKYDLGFFLESNASLLFLFRIIYYFLVLEANS
jgi:hypothetical protein